MARYFEPRTARPRRRRALLAPAGNRPAHPLSRHGPAAHHRRRRAPRGHGRFPRHHRAEARGTRDLGVAFPMAVARRARARLHLERRSRRQGAVHQPCRARHRPGPGDRHSLGSRRPPEQQDRIQRALDACIRGEGSEYEVSAPRGDGSLRWYSCVLGRSAGTGKPRAVGSPAISPRRS